MTKLFFFVSLLFSFFSQYACSCRWDYENYYQFFEQNKSLFVGNIVRIKTNGIQKTYVIKVIDPLRSHFRDTCYLSDQTSNCAADLKINETYILCPYRTLKNWKTWQISRCDYIISEKHNNKAFSHDTMLIRLFSKKTFSVDCRYFKIDVVNGKRNGQWVEYNTMYYDTINPTKEISETGRFYHGKSSGQWIRYCTRYNDTTSPRIEICETGQYYNGKKDGKWTKKDTETYYNKGKFIKNIYFSDSIKFISYKNSEIAYRSDGNVYKKIDYRKKTYTAYYANGKLKETAKFDRKNSAVKFRIKYNSDGSVKEKIIVNKEDYIEISDLFWDNNE